MTDFPNDGGDIAIIHKIKQQTKRIKLHPPNTSNSPDAYGIPCPGMASVSEVVTEVQPRRMPKVARTWDSSKFQAQPIQRYYQSPDLDILHLHKVDEHI